MVQGLPGSDEVVEPPGAHATTGAPVVPARPSTRPASSSQSPVALRERVSMFRDAVRAAGQRLTTTSNGNVASAPPLGPVLAEHANVLAHGLGRLPQRQGSVEQQRQQNLSTALRRFSEEVHELDHRPAADQQRLAAAAQRLCTWAELALGPAQPTNKPSLSAAPSAPPRRLATKTQPSTLGKPVPDPTKSAANAVASSDASTAAVKTPISQPPTPQVAAEAAPQPHRPSARLTAVALPMDSDETDPLSRSLVGLPGVGPRTAERLAARGLVRVVDILYFLPRRWEDLRALKPVGALQEGQVQSTVAIVERSRIVPAGRRFLDVTARGEDGTPLSLRWFYFHGGMLRRLQPGQRLRVVGSPQRFKGILQLVHPEIDFLDTDDEHASGQGRIRTRYPDVEGVPARTLEKLCRHVCSGFSSAVPDGIPSLLQQKLSLPTLPDALRSLHLADEELQSQIESETTPPLLDLLNQGLAPAQRRLIFEELFFLQLGLMQRRRKVRSEESSPCPSDPRSLDALRQVLPFTPTRAQERAIAEIAADLARPLPMQRLVHGDVGSGKTLVAYAACELVMAAGRQAAIMAPTEILAEQHARTLGTWAKATGRRLCILTATTPKSPRKTTLALLQAGRFDDVWQHAERSGERLDRESILAMLTVGYIHVVVGTHALLAERVEFADLGLVVIDEQHRFGVAQRAALRRKGRTPHLLVMTATPIPRTLALTLYGDLDITQIDELPPGRTPPVTRVLAGAAGLSRALTAVRRAVSAGRQAYWVCPLIEESEKLDFQSVTSRHASLVAALPELRIGLVHGRLLSDERDAIMDRFRRGELHVLCATTVIEVGVDVPNASLMVIEGAERFGLAQLHQLRGRIGRGEGASACLLLHDTPAELPQDGVDQAALPGTGHSDDSVLGESPSKAATDAALARSDAKAAADGGGGARQRLGVLSRSCNGFHIAEADLRMRGPGEVLGTRQAGLPPLRYADLLRDIDLLQIARREAAALVRRDPDLELPEHRHTRQLVRERWAFAEESTTLE
ncbi:MAG: DEAD/DEAH box helicase [Myxococcales bacterium]|nr:DEAD/DEAH box helicase [Myxococcales bacterium]